jgi:hypothetical protein
MYLYLDVLFVVTLMRLTELDAYVESGDEGFTYYFRVPAKWAEEPGDGLREHVDKVAQKMYEDLNEQFHIAEPNDPNYLKVKSAITTELDEKEVQSKIWLQAPPPAVWEWTPCIVVNEDGSYAKVNPSDF